MWTSNCYWNMMMFTLHTSTLMKIWSSTVKGSEGQNATISCWLNWLGPYERKAFTSTYHMGWHSVKRRQTPFPTGQPKGCSDRTAIMTKCVVVVWSGRAQKQTNKKQYTIRVVWICLRSIISISRWFQGGAAPRFWHPRCYEQNLSKHHPNNVMSSILRIVLFPPPIVYPQKVCSRRPFYWATSRQNDFLRSQSLRARAQYVLQDRVCTCSNFSNDNSINLIFFPAAIGFHWVVLLFYSAQRNCDPHARHGNIVTKTYMQHVLRNF